MLYVYILQKGKEVSKKTKKEQNKDLIIKALDITTNEVISEGFDSEKVIEQAEKSGQEYIIDFQTNPDYNFVF